MPQKQITVSRKGPLSASAIISNNNKKLKKAGAFGRALLLISLTQGQTPGKIEKAVLPE